ncbi:hypothetical protein [Hymenobacter edaphi]|uniref:hypothetical protein n=1 Tax=Hymenobacter edaphi TaxID=2211146 RepID=UPI0014020106|nr:hypothetical protein [Hymenobacter edaphi]
MGVEIHGDVNSPFLTVNLKDVLPCLIVPEPVQWHLLYLNVWGETGIADYGDHGETVNTSPEGLSISMQGVRQLADAPAQIVDLILLGSADVTSLHRYRTGRGQMYKACEYVIEVVDSSYLIVHSHDEAFITCLCNSLEGVKPVG